MCSTLSLPNFTGYISIYSRYPALGASIVPNEYLWTALLYSTLYCTAAMLLALIFFEDRDLA